MQRAFPPKTGEMVRFTKALLEDLRTDRRGYTRATLKALGVSWKPGRGPDPRWPRLVLGREITRAAFEAAMAGRTQYTPLTLKLRAKREQDRERPRAPRPAGTWCGYILDEFDSTAIVDLELRLQAHFRTGFVDIMKLSGKARRAAKREVRAWIAEQRRQARQPEAEPEVEVDPRDVEGSEDWLRYHGLYHYYQALPGDDRISSARERVLERAADRILAAADGRKAKPTPEPRPAPSPAPEPPASRSPDDLPPPWED